MLLGGVLDGIKYHVTGTTELPELRVLKTEVESTLGRRITLGKPGRPWKYPVLEKL